MSDTRVEVRDIVVPSPPKEVVITLPYRDARRLMEDIALLSGDRVVAWTVFASLSDAGVTPSYVSRENP